MSLAPKTGPRRIISNSPKQRNAATHDRVLEKDDSQLSSEPRFMPLIRSWKRQLLEDGPSVFASNGERKQREQEAQEAELYEQIGRLKMELEWLKKKVARFDS